MLVRMRAHNPPTVRQKTYTSAPPWLHEYSNAIDPASGRVRWYSGVCDAEAEHLKTVLIDRKNPDSKPLFDVVEDLEAAVVIERQDIRREQQRQGITTLGTTVIAQPRVVAPTVEAKKDPGPPPVAIGSAIEAREGLKAVGRAGQPPKTEAPETKVLPKRRGSRKVANG